MPTITLPSKIPSAKNGFHFVESLAEGSHIQISQAIAMVTGCPVQPDSKALPLKTLCHQTWRNGAGTQLRASALLSAMH